MADEWFDDVAAGAFLPETIATAEALEAARQAKWLGYAEGLQDSRLCRPRPRVRSLVRPGGRR
ncbi:hypothetical protein ABT369_05345 [Dactylosporangium sp. NPDC000244]|uniref:hypothetical protein n=1 Tax=Dactylosporangium sp. NPDC000244 TaxID=3154365 RepID=UPI0033201D10